MSSNGESGVGGVIFLLALMWFFGAFKNNDEYFVEANVYPLTCVDVPVNGSGCNSKWKAGIRGVFSVYGPQQAVVVRYLSDTSSAPSRLEHCIVADSKNWACDGQRMIEGNYTSDWVTDGSIEFVSWWRWWLAKINL